MRGARVRAESTHLPVITTSAPQSSAFDIGNALGKIGNLLALLLKKHNIHTPGKHSYCGQRMAKVVQCRYPSLFGTSPHQTESVKNCGQSEANDIQFT